MDCARCGTCCVAPDIASLQKPLGIRCPHLSDSCQCTIYDDRPAVCRSYRADSFCRLIDAPTMEERVRIYLDAFGLRPLDARDQP